MEPVEKYPLTPELLFNLTGGRDFIGPLQKFNVPMQVLLVVFEVITPVSLTLNFFVFFSCIAILIRKTSDRPALIFIAYNALLDVFIITSDHIVMTGAANPPLGDVPIGGVLPDEEELTRRCSVEKALVSFTMFSSLGSVLLLTVDRYIFITQPLRYNVFVTLPRAIYLTLASTLIAAAGAVWYSFSVTLPWDLVCTFTHVLPLSMVIFWNVLFFLTYFAMHIMYLVILVIALKHKKRIEQTKSPSTSTTNMTVLRRDGSTFSLDPSVSTVTGEEEARKRAAATAKSRRKSASEVVINMLKESSQVHATFKTIRYIVLLLLIYSLVELPVVAVAIEDMIDHLGWNNGDGLGGTKCGEDLSSIPLPWEERTRLTMLQCMETFISGTAVCCLLESRVPLVELPMCHMAAESSHALHLTRIFTMSLLGWIANALADPIVYAFWYPVFRKNLVKLILKVKEKVAYGERSDITPGVFGIS